VKPDADQESSDAQKKASARSFVSMEYIAKEKARLVLLKRKRNGSDYRSTHPLAMSLHYGWW
jgi:hypothetical protein